jgi:hypothetical protein
VQVVPIIPATCCKAFKHQDIREIHGAGSECIEYSSDMRKSIAGKELRLAKSSDYSSDMRNSKCGSDLLPMAQFREC